MDRRFSTSSLPEGVPSSPRQYLREVLPSLINPKLFGERGVVQFLVIDDQQADHFLTITPKGVHPQPGRATQPELTLAFLGDDLLAFARGELDVDRALGDRRLRIYGNEELLLRLASALRSTVAQ